LLPNLIARVPDGGAQLHWRTSVFCGLFVLRQEIVRQDVTVAADMLRQFFVQGGNEQQLQASMHILYVHGHGSDPSGFFPIILVIWGLASRHVFSPEVKRADGNKPCL
jgi:hypothetical protein